LRIVPRGSIRKNVRFAVIVRSLRIP
jgi:hypothetical protein